MPWCLSHNFDTMNGVFYKREAVDYYHILSSLLYCQHTTSFIYGTIPCLFIIITKPFYLSHILRNTENQIIQQYLL